MNKLIARRRLSRNERRAIKAEVERGKAASALYHAVYAQTYAGQGILQARSDSKIADNLRLLAEYGFIEITRDDDPYTVAVPKSLIGFQTKF